MDLTAAIRIATIKLGYKELKANQELAVRSLVNGRDVFVAYPLAVGNLSVVCVLPVWSVLFNVARKIHLALH